MDNKKSEHETINRRTEMFSRRHEDSLIILILTLLLVITCFFDTDK